MTTSPFGKYAGMVAAGMAFIILTGWIVSVLHIGGAQPSAGLDAAAYLIIGVVFGVGAGAGVVANGVGLMGVAANTRLDAIGAPSASASTEIVKQNGNQSTPLTDTTTPSEPPPLH